MLPLYSTALWAGGRWDVTQAPRWAPLCDGVPISPHSTALLQIQPRSGGDRLPLCGCAGRGRGHAAGAAVPLQEAPLPEAGRGAHGAWGAGGRRGAAGVPSLTPSLSFLRAKCQRNPPLPVTPPGDPAVPNKDAAAPALVSHLSCTPVGVKSSGRGSGLGWRSRGADGGGARGGGEGGGLHGAPPRVGWAGGRARAGRHAHRLPSARLHSAEAAARSGNGGGCGAGVDVGRPPPTWKR